MKNKISGFSKYIKQEESDKKANVVNIFGEIEFGVESLSKLNSMQHKINANLLAENMRLHKELMIWRYSIGLVLIAAVIAYTLVG